MFGKEKNVDELVWSAIKSMVDLDTHKTNMILSLKEKYPYIFYELFVREESLEKMDSIAGEVIKRLETLRDVG